MANGAQSRRSDDPLDTPVARAGCRHLGRGDVPLAEVSEAYEVEIRDGTAIKRTLTATTTSALYPAAQQIADWGVLLGPGNSLQLRIYQLSAVIGRGAARSVTLTF